MSTTQAMVEIMKGMGQIMGKATEAINVNNIQHVVEDFNMKMEEQEGVNEMLNDVMDQDEDEVDDEVGLLEGR